MPELSAIVARGLYKDMIIDVYREHIEPKLFFSSFFEETFSRTRTVSIEVRRGVEAIAVDVMRGAEGNRNQITKSTLKTIKPPYNHEYFDATQMDIYDRLFGTLGSIDSEVFNDFLQEVAAKLTELRDKILRAIELRCAQVFETGIVKLKFGININFGRKAESLVDLGSGNYWVDLNRNIYKDFENAGIFQRRVGKVGGARFNAIMGTEAFNYMKMNNVFLKNQDLKNMSLDGIAPAQVTAEGGLYRGFIEAGSYKFDIWTYDEVYDDPTTGLSTPYMNPKLIFVIPPKPRFKLANAAVPQLFKGVPTPKQGKFLLGEFTDEKATAHNFDIKNACVPVPVAIDTIYTVKVLA